MIPCGLMAVGITGLFYTPVVVASDGIDRVINNRFVNSLPWQEFLSRLPGHISTTTSSFVRDIPIPILIVSLVLLVGGICTTVLDRRWTTFMLLPCIALGGALILFAKHAIPFDRTWIYLLPLVFVLMDTGLTAGVMDSYGVKRSAAYVKYFHLLLAGCAALLIMNRNLISSYPDTGHFPVAPVLVDFLSDTMMMSPQDRIVAKSPADAPMLFYMWHRDAPEEEGILAQTLVGRQFLVVKPSCYSLSGITQGTGNVQMLLSIGDATLYVADMEKDTKTFQQVDAPVKE